MILSVQCAVGEPGSKPVTQLKYPSGPFLGMVSVGGNHYGLNDGGMWQINYVDPETGIPKDDGQPVEYSTRLNASDFGYPGNIKKLMYIYSVMSSSADCATAPNVTAQPDDQDGITYTKKLVSQKQTRTPIKCRCQGTYWTIGLDGNIPFTLLSMSVNFIVRPGGISNG